MNSPPVIPPIHRGEVLMDEYLEPLGVTQHRLAVAIGVPPRRINEIVHGARAISADTAIATARYVFPVPAGPTPKTRSWRSIAST